MEALVRGKLMSLLVVLGLGCSSAEAEDDAGETTGANHADCGGKCGGSPVGAWIFTGETSCDTVPVSHWSTSVQECPFEFVRGSDGTLNVQMYGLDLSGQPMTQGTFDFREDGSYAMGALYSANAQMLHPATCRQAVAPLASCAEIEVLAGNALLGEGVGRNYRCMEDGEGGCACTFVFSAVSGQAGTWQVTADGKLLLQPNNTFPDAPAPRAITYCVSDTLALGPEVLLPGQTQTGIAIVLQRIDCTDGLQGAGENGPDCGLACGVICPSCSDGAQSPGEEGVDCGLACSNVCP